MWRVFLAMIVLGMACKTKEPAAPTDAGAVEVRPPPPAGPTGDVRGTVKFSGAPPPMPLLSRGADSYCARQPPARSEEVVVNPNGTLRNVVVSVLRGVKWAYPTPARPVEIRQKSCIYVPRVQAAMVGQEILVYNDDQTMHNVHSFKGTDGWFNRPQPAGGRAPIREKIPNGAILTFRCDVHPWMRAYVYALRHPFASVTGTDGSFHLRGLPPGTYTLEAWHERYGAKTATVTVEPSKTAEVSFEFSP